jgi:hypothetical protein
MRIWWIPAAELRVVHGWTGVEVLSSGDWHNSAAEY